MTPYLDIQHLTKSIGDLVLFEDISFSVAEGQHVGLIARNGAGKSTLLSIISGKDSADDGQIVFMKGLRIGLLEQQPVFDPQQTVIQAVTSRLKSDYASLLISEYGSQLSAHTAALDADEAWKAFSQQKFGNSKDISNVVPMRPVWCKIAAAAIAVVVISGLTVAAVHGNWLHIDEAPETAVEQETTTGHSGYTDHIATDTVANARQVEILDDVTLEALLEQMAAHYGAEVQFADDALRTMRLHFEWDKSLSLERNVQLLNNFSKFSVSIANDVITVSNPEEK